MTLTTRRVAGLGVTAALLALAVGSALLASSQNTAGVPPPFRRSMAPQQGMSPLAGLGLAVGRLDLTEEQRAQFRTIMQSHVTDWKELTDRMSKARQALNAAVAADIPDEPSIRERSAAVAAVQADLAVVRAKVRAEVFGILTPEQQERAKQMQQQMGRRMRPMGGLQKRRNPRP